MLQQFTPRSHDPATVEVQTFAEIVELLARARRLGTGLQLASPALATVAQRLGIRERTKTGAPILRFGVGRRGRLDRAASRIVGWLVAVVVLVAGAPLWALIGLAIRLESAGGALYVGTRAGLAGRPFAFCKFRTMWQSAGSAPDAQRLAIIRGERQTYARDAWDRSRVTGIGRWLRRFGLDEIPQFVHVLCGQMAVVGPRPYEVEELAAAKPWHALRQACLPGITGLWQVAARHQVSFDESVLIDIYYLSNASFWLDLRIMARTPWQMLAGTGNL